VDGSPYTPTVATKRSSAGSYEQAKQAKSLDPEYQKLTVYIPRTLHRAVKSKLVLQGKELSQLVSELLESWNNRTR
jgi:hypothetical protein